METSRAGWHWVEQACRPVGTVLEEHGERLVRQKQGIFPELKS